MRGNIIKNRVMWFAFEQIVCILQAWSSPVSRTVGTREVYFSYTLLFKEIRILGIILISPHNTTRLIPDLYLTNTWASMLIPLIAKQLKLSQRTSFSPVCPRVSSAPRFRWPRSRRNRLRWCTVKVVTFLVTLLRWQSRNNVSLNLTGVLLLS